MVEMLVILPIALVMISVIILAIVQLSNQAVIANERARKTADINRALKIIEKDISLSNKFLTKVTLLDHQGNELALDTDSPQFTSSVRHGIKPLYEDNTHLVDVGSDKPTIPFLPPEKQPRLILNRLATFTNPDSGDYLKTLVHYHNGPHNGENCRYNEIVFFNVVYYIRQNRLYRRLVLHPKISNQNEQDVDMYCHYTKAGKNFYEIPFQLPSCSAYDFRKGSISYCLAKDELLVSDVQMEVEYFTEDGQSIDNNVINGLMTDEDDRRDELAKADGVIVKLTSKIVLAEGDAETVVTGRTVGVKVPLTSTNN